MRINVLIIIILIIPLMSRIKTEVVEYYWRDYIGEVPKDAVEAAPGLYIGQIPYNGLLPGTIYPLKQVAITSGDGHKIETKDGVKILCSEKNNEKKFKWNYVNIKSLTAQKTMQLVRGGWENGYRLYVGKIYHEGDWKIGKIFPPGSGLQGLRIWYNNGPEYVSLDFQILLYEDNAPSNKTKRTNTYQKYQKNRIYQKDQTSNDKKRLKTRSFRKFRGIKSLKKHKISNN